MVINVGDSILNLNGINEKGASRTDDIVEVRPHSGVTIEVLIDYIEPVTRRKLGIVALHIGTNDIRNGMNTQERLLKIVCILHRESKGTNNVFSPVVARSDKSDMPS